MIRAKIGAFEALEQEYASFVGHKYGVAVNTGTAALHLSLAALGIGKGDEVIIPDFTMASCAFAVAYTGAKVVTVDCKDDLTINEFLIEEKITDKTKAIMPVHIYGRLCNMHWINHLAKKHDLFVVEDAAEAQGARLGKSTVSCCSFYRNKIIHAEEGGMVTTDDEELYLKMKDLKNMAFGTKHNYHHSQIGFNYRMPNSTAEMALRSFDSYEQNAKKRRDIEEMLNDHFPEAWQMPARDAVWVYDFIPPDIFLLRKRLEGKQFREFFKPISTFPMFKQKTGDKAKFWASRGHYLRVNPKDSHKKIQRVCKNIL